jgi:hypothetical protein
MSQLQKLDEKKKFDTTVEKCYEWIRILNEEIFDGKLTEILEIDIRWRRKAWAYYEYDEDSKDPTISKLRLLMNKRYRSEKFFVEILAHELIHHYQFLYHGIVDHGPTFFSWKEKLEQKGLNLAECYDEE